MSCGSIASHEFKKLLGHGFNKQRRIAIALSGGVDSMCLAALLQEQLGQSSGENLFAFTVNHRLRSGSTEEADKVHEQVRRMNIRHEVLDIDPLPIIGVEKHARIARYRALNERCLHYGIEDLYLAHHADDQVETILMRLVQGSRWQGLIGMRAESGNPLSRTMFDAHRIRLHRPLLTVPKARLITTCREKNIEWHEDYTNDNAGLTLRNAIRYMLRKPETMPNAIRPKSLLNMSETLLNADVRQGASMHEIWEKTSAVLRKSTCSIEWNMTPLFEMTGSDDLKARFLETICHIISPTAMVERSSISHVVKMMQEHLNDGQKMKVSAGGLLWCLNDGRCVTQRQPFHRHEKVFQELDIRTQPPERETLLFDRRFWIIMQNRQSPITIRNLQKSDIAKLRELDKRSSAQSISEWLAVEAKGDIRFTIPIILDRSGKIMGLPSADICFEPSLAVACSLAGNGCWPSLKMDR